MKPPIIVYEPGDASIFESVGSAEAYLEPIDVKNNEYVAYDSEGRLLRLSATNFKVTIASAEPEATHMLELRKILSDFLAHKGAPQEWLQIASLQELVTKALEYKSG
jgi:hypothetical protein